MKVNSKGKKVGAYAINIILFLGTLVFRLMRRKSRIVSDQPRILVSRPDRIGDVLMSTPVYHSLREKFPNSKIVMICYPPAVSLMKSNPYIDEIWSISCPWWETFSFRSYKTFFINAIKIIKRIKAENFDIFIELRGDVRLTFLFGWLPNIPMIISNDRSGGKFLLTHCVELDNDLHEIEKNYQLLTFFEPIKKYLKPEVFTDNDTGFFNNFSINEKYVVIFNGGRSTFRRLEENKVIDIVTNLNEKYNVQCVMVGDQLDSEMAARIALKVNNKNAFVNLCGKISLLQVKIVIDKAKLFIGIDSSINHIAASTNTPSITLFGPVTPSQAKQIGENKLNIFHKYPCAPCLQKKCIVNNSESEAQCMKDIKVLEVLNMADGFLNDTGLSNSKKAISNSHMRYQ